jgi:hypothetical protein
MDDHGDPCGWWKKSESPVARWAKNPMIYRVETCFNHPFGGAGFLPSTVLTKSWESFLSPSDGNFPKSWYHEQIDQTSHQKRP